MSIFAITCGIYHNKTCRIIACNMIFKNNGTRMTDMIHDFPINHWKHTCKLPCVMLCSGWQYNRFLSHVNGIVQLFVQLHIHTNRAPYVFLTQGHFCSESYTQSALNSHLRSSPSTQLQPLIVAEGGRQQYLFSTLITNCSQPVWRLKPSIFQSKLTSPTFWLQPPTFHHNPRRSASSALPNPY